MASSCSAPGFRQAPVVVVEIDQGALREAGTASIFVQGCTSLVLFLVQELLNPLFTCHSYCHLKYSHLAERAGGKTEPPEQGSGEWWEWGRKIHHSIHPGGGTGWPCHLSHRVNVKLLHQCCCS